MRTPRVDIYLYRGLWVADIPDPKTGKRRRRSFGPDENIARRDFHRHMAQLYDGALPQRGDTTFNQLADRYLDWLTVNRSPETRRWYSIYFHWVTHYPDGDSKLGRRLTQLISPLDMEDVKGHHLQQNCSARAANSFVQAIKRLGSWGAKMRLIPRNPWADIERVPREAGDVNVPGDALFHQVHGWLDRYPPAGDYARLLYLTAARPGEILAARWDQWRCDVVPKTKGSVIVVPKHKTSGRTGRPRLIPLVPQAHKIVEAQPREGETIFAQPDGSSYPYYWMAARLKRVRRAHPEAKAYQFKLARHRGVTALRNAGVPVHLSQGGVGHSSTLTHDIYTHAAPADVLVAFAKAMGGEEDDRTDG